MPLLAVDAALKAVLSRTPPPDVETVPWLQALGRTLLEPVQARVDDPPFDRSSMDGFAVPGAGLSEPYRLQVLERVLAGDLPTRPVGPGQCTKVMTGAPIPVGAGSVVPVEDCRETDGWVDLRGAPAPGLHIRRRGENARAGQVIFGEGHRLDAVDLAVGANLAVVEAGVARRPSAAIVSTGSELVPAGAVPGPGQVVNSNGPMLAALWRGWGGTLAQERMVSDDERQVEEAVEEALQADYLILSGGVSAGDADLVPDLLRNAGVEMVFHKVAMKPGKPIYFGARDRCLVVGLPGNPASSLVGALLFLWPSIMRRLGLEQPAWRHAPLGEAVRASSVRTRFEPGRTGRDGETVHLVPHMGSGDLPAWRLAEVLVELPAGGPGWQAGDRVRCLPFRRAAG